MDKERCSFCNKKLKLIHFTCKCEKLFCSNHRYAHSHNCTFLTNKQADSKKKNRRQKSKNRTFKDRANLMFIEIIINTNAYCENGKIFS